MTKEEELFKAAEDGNIKKVKSLLNPKLLGIIKPVDVNITREDGWTLLMAAAYKGHRDIVTLLMEKGALVNAKTNDCFTPLMAAAKYGYKEIAELFLDHGADIHAAKTGEDPGWNAMLKQAGARYGVTTAPTEQEAGEQEGLPRISAAVTNIYLKDSSTMNLTGAGGSFFQEAIQCHNNRDDNGAARNFQKAIDAGLDKLRQGYAHANLGVLRLKKNQVAPAISHFMKVFALKEVLYESAHDAVQYLAVIYSELGRPDEAARLEQVAYQTQARLGYSLAPDMAEKVRKTVRQQKNKLLK